MKENPSEPLEKRLMEELENLNNQIHQKKRKRNIILSTVLGVTAAVAVLGYSSFYYFTRNQNKEPDYQAKTEQVQAASIDKIVSTPIYTSTPTPKVTPTSEPTHMYTPAQLTITPKIPQIEDRKITHLDSAKKVSTQVNGRIITGEEIFDSNNAESAVKINWSFGGVKYIQNAPLVNGSVIGFTGFNSIIEIDFDGDSIADKIIWYDGYGGSGWPTYCFCASSKMNKAWIYKCYEGAGYWTTFDKFPNKGYPFCITEDRDWMPQFPEIKEMDKDFLSHAEQVGFIFTQVWNGDGFSYRPVTKFYQSLLPEVERLVSDPKQSDYARKMYQRIAIDFRNAAQGLDISPETRGSSCWTLITSIKAD